MNSLFTVFVGVLEFVIGQAIEKFLLNPLQEQRRLIGEIASAILVFANIGPLPQHIPPDGLVLAETHLQTSKMLRTLASRLRASLWSIPLYGFWAGVGAVHSRETILQASQQLVGESNTLSRRTARNPTRQGRQAARPTQRLAGVDGPHDDGRWRD